MLSKTHASHMCPFLGKALYQDTALIQLCNFCCGHSALDCDETPTRPPSDFLSSKVQRGKKSRGSRQGDLLPHSKQTQLREN